MPECNWEVTEAADNSLHQSNFQGVNHKIQTTVVSSISYYWNLWFAIVSCYLRTHRGMRRLVNSRSTTNLDKIYRGDHGSGPQTAYNSPKQPIMSTKYVNKLCQPIMSTIHVSTNQVNNSASTSYASTNHVNKVCLQIMSTFSVDKFGVNELCQHVAQSSPKQSRGNPNSSPDQPKAAQATQSSPEQPTTAQSNPEQPTTAQSNPGQPRTAQNSPKQPRATHSSPEQPRAAHMQTLQPGSQSVICSTHKPDTK